MNARKFLMGIGLASALVLSACGGGGSDQEPAEGNSGGTGGGASAAAATTLEVSADPNGALGFVPATLTAPAGQPFTVNFDNPASTNVPHNWVVVEQGQEQAVAQAALATGGDVPEDTPGLLVDADVLQAGNSEEIEVEGLEAGTYSYICTFPGHYPSMKGTLTVQ